MERIIKISVEDNIEFNTIADVFNTCFGKDYEGFQKGYYVMEEGMAVWFPKLAKSNNGELTAANKKAGWINVLTDDGMTIIEENNDPEKNYEVEGKKYNTTRYVFVKRVNEPYKFAGIFKADIKESTSARHIYRRISAVADLSKWYPTDINTPMEPASIKEIEDDELLIECGRCHAEFVLAKRCTRCGQLLLIKWDM